LPKRLPRKTYRAIREKRVPAAEARHRLIAGSKHYRL
jgi:hypothetical protein